MLKWVDTLDIAIELAEKYPEKDAQWINFVELRKLVLSLKNFEDDPERCNEKILRYGENDFIKSIFLFSNIHSFSVVFFIIKSEVGNIFILLK